MNYDNSGGSRGVMCGHGVRCFPEFVYAHGVVRKKCFSGETDAGVKYIDLTLESGEVKCISVDVGSAAFRATSVP